MGAVSGLAHWGQALNVQPDSNTCVQRFAIGRARDRTQMRWAGGARSGQNSGAGDTILLRTSQPWQHPSIDVKSRIQGADEFSRGIRPRRRQNQRGTKAAPNEFHGTVYDFLRNTRSGREGFLHRYQTRASQVAKTAIQTQSIWGYSRRNNNRQKHPFLFRRYGFLSESTYARTQQATVANAHVKNGDFSDMHGYYMRHRTKPERLSSPAFRSGNALPTGGFNPQCPPTAGHGE